MTSEPAIYGLILAGGLARRMGGGDKALIRIGDKTILERAIATLAPQCAGLLLNANGELARFALDLRSITQGRGSFEMKFDHYEEMPAHIAKGIIEQFQKEHEAAASAH